MAVVLHQLENSFAQPQSLQVPNLLGDAIVYVINDVSTPHRRSNLHRDFTESLAKLIGRVGDASYGERHKVRHTEIRLRQGSLHGQMPGKLGILRIDHKLCQLKCNRQVQHSNQ